ncbi:MAG: transporter ATP-binding protein [Ramlibacter sp.]|nr:transporter ATP-binding protein [Ramlibacter sp.]
MSTGIEFRNVTKRYGADPAAPLAVQGISFAVERGTLVTILGPSGCGKTTTLRMIAGLEAPTSGQILIDGRDVTTLGPSDRNVSMMFQSYALFPHMDVLENVSYGLRMSGEPKEAARRRAADALRNQQQRVALARALVLEPAVLLFDEPLSNLDARLRREMREEIRALQQRLQLTVAYVTHDQSEALAVSDRIIVMDHGVIAQAGSPQELAVRPEAWHVGPPGHGLNGRLAKLAYLGSNYEYTFETELGSIFVVSPEVGAVLSLGSDVGLQLGGHGVSVVQVA